MKSGTLWVVAEGSNVYITLSVTVFSYLPKPSVVMSIVVKIAFSAYSASHTYTPSRCRQEDRDERQSRR
jgi:hypothetical protein